MGKCSLRAVALAAALAAVAGCLETRYVVQAGIGQAELLAKGRDIDDVLADPAVPLRTKVLLRESRHVLRFAGEHGLDDRGNYQRFVDLGRSAVVWFMAACPPLSFDKLTWSFPIAGSFPYLGWFDRGEARRIRDRLRKDGYDVYVRPVHAYSTGGWFNDPILSTMLSGDGDALRSLVNVLLHELTHANVFVPDQSTFNESLASFVGDGMTADYLRARFGPESAELALFSQELEEDRRRGAALSRAYAELDAIYKGQESRESKLAAKDRLLRQLERELGLGVIVNNALLIGFQTYNTGLAELEQLYSACGRDWKRFLDVVRTLEPDDFSTEQDEEIGPEILALRPRCKAVAGSGAQERGDGVVIGVSDRRRTHAAHAATRIDEDVHRQ